MENQAPSSLRVQQLAPAMVALLATIGLSLAVEIVMATLPLRTGDSSWRFQSVGRLLNTTPQWALILVLVLLIGLLGERFGVVKWGAIACLVLAAVLASLLPFFGLDFLAVRHLQPQSRLPEFQRTGLRLGGISGLLVLGLFWAGVRGLTAARTMRPVKKPGAPELVIGER